MYANNQGLNLDNVIDVDAVEVITTPRERGFWDVLLGSSGNTLVETAQQAILIDKCRASLTYSAIQHAMAYSVMETQLASTSPRGAQRIGALIDAYTVQAAKTIQGW